METKYPTSWTENSDEIERLRAQRDELVAVLVAALAGVMPVVAAMNAATGAWNKQLDAARAALASHNLLLDCCRAARVRRRLPARMKTAYLCARLACWIGDWLELSLHCPRAARLVDWLLIDLWRK